MTWLIKNFKVKRIIQGRICKRADLIISLTEIVKKENIKAGVITGIGALSRVVLGYYDQNQKRYAVKTLEKPFELLSLKGNISVKEKQIFLHLHAVLGDENLSSFGGHLFEGTEVFAFEFEIIEFEGEEWIRRFDQETGLYLWTKEEGVIERGEE